VTDKPLSRRELVNRLKEFVCGATGSGSVVWGDEMLLKEYAAIVQSESGTVSVPRSLAERTEAMFRFVDPEGCIAQEWKDVIQR
jgi:hypothetical protein